ncbi:TlpA family protein disulfide reductase [Halanaerobaculum tunisiense]
MKSSLKLLLVAGLIVGVVSLGIIYHNQGLTEDKSKLNQEAEAKVGISIGDTAPDFTLQNLAGEEVSLSDFRGKFVMVNFWATWCPPCRAEMPALDSFYETNKEDFVVLGVNLGEEKSQVKSFIEDGDYEYPILLDQSRKIARNYRVSVIPTSYFVGPKGKIQYVKKGVVSEAELNQIKNNLESKIDQ